MISQELPRSVGGADLEANAVLACECGGCQVGGLVSGVVAHLATGLPGVHSVSHLVDLQLCIPRPLESEGDRVVQQKTDSLLEKSRDYLSMIFKHSVLFEACDMKSVTMSNYSEHDEEPAY